MSDFLKEAFRLKIHLFYLLTFEIKLIIDLDGKTKKIKKWLC